MTFFPTERFSRFLFVSMLIFMGITLALVMGSLYWMLSISIGKEFANEVRARQAEVDMTLHENFTRIGSKLNELSLDNSLRVNLMLGMDQRIDEQLSMESAFPEGARIILYNDDWQRIYPQHSLIKEDLAAVLLAMGQENTQQCKRFVPLDESGLVSIWSVPVMRRDERLGTLFTVYDLSRDAVFWKRAKDTSSANIYLHVGTDLINLRTLEVLKSITGTDMSPELSTGIIPGMIVTSLKDFPGLSYVVSSKSLRDRKRSLFWMLSGMLVCVIVLTFLMSSMLVRKLAKPLDNMVAQVSSIADEPFSTLLQTDQIPYSEFKTLGMAFNQVLARLLEVKDQENQAHNFLNAIINTAADPIFVKNDRRERIIVNDAYCDLVEVPRDELIGHTDEQIHNQDEAMLFRETDLYVLETGMTSEDENIVTSRTGKERQISTKKTLLVNPVTGERFIVGVIRDVTESKWLEEELAHHRDHLADLVAEQTAALSETNIKLMQEIEERRRAEDERRVMEARLQRAQKMELIGTLAGGVAHDLNNILSGIVSYPELLLMELKKDNPMRKKVEIISKAGVRASEIVQDLLTLTRRGVTVSVPVNLNSIVGDYLESPEMSWMVSRHAGVEIRSNFDPDLMNIKGSSTHLSKVVMNLVTNAAEAMPKGGVIDISTKNQCIEEPVHGYDTIEPGSYVVLSVCDTGVGIDEEDLERIFEPFYTKKIMGRSGTGLGMAVVWGTVKDHCGYIDVQSRKNRGTTFTLYFPASTEMIEEPNPQSIDELMGSGETIVVVDDDEEQRTIACDILTALKYNVVCLPSGEAAVEYLKEHEADLVMIDMIMEPGMDGLDTYREIIARKASQKVIIASGFAETDRVRDAQKLGAGSYVKKPYRLERIGQVIKEELG